jgi:hypothetical protein
LTVWHQGKATINRLLNNMPFRMRATHKLSSCMPYDIVEMIIAHLACDLATIKTCSLTCRSWYTAAAPHIHRTLSLSDGLGPLSKLHEPLSELRELDLMSLVKEIRVMQRGDSRWFVPQAFSPSDLRCFLAFANVHTLQIRHLDINCFIPGIERYFQQFLPTLRSISLYSPICSGQQLSYFLSLFPNLDDLDIEWFPPSSVPIHTMEFVPFSTPKLRGRLTLRDFRSMETCTYLIAGCEGLRFQYMDLRNVGGCAPILLKACAETLETLRVDTAEDTG